MKSNVKSVVNMHVALLFYSTLFMLSSTMYAQESIWEIDPSHSSINFDVSYFKVGTIKGAFNTFSGSFTQEKDNISAINITIKTASINTNQENRDAHLRTADFFNTAIHPEIVFISSSIKKTGDTIYEIKGDLTLSGISKSIVLKGIDNGSFIHPRYKTNNKFITIIGIINREDFKIGINYPPAKIALGNEVQLISEIQLIQNNKK